ncbi:MAG: prephenate dehydratase domain-containing protein [Rhodothermales bacterium]
MTIVYQGEPGAYSEAAALADFPDARLSGLPTFRRVFDAVASGEAARGVVPVENSIGGSIVAVLDGLLEVGGLRIVGERWDRIAHALLAVEGTALEDVREVRSHPQALRQCAASLRNRLPQAELVEAFDTAGAARQIAQDKLAGVAAIASARAAELYGLHVLAEHVESERSNVTRFLVIARDNVEPERGGAMKTMLALTPGLAVPNALFRSLTAFVGRRLRVWKVEPRPRPDTPGAYRYLVDVEGDAEAEPLKSALADLPALNDAVRVLGSYPAGEIPG